MMTLNLDAAVRMTEAMKSEKRATTLRKKQPSSALSAESCK